MASTDTRGNRLGAAIGYFLAIPFLLTLCIVIGHTAASGAYHPLSVIVLYMKVQVLSPIPAVLWYYVGHTRIAVMYMLPILTATCYTLVSADWLGAIGVWFLASLILACHPLLPAWAVSNTRPGSH